MQLTFLGTSDGHTRLGRQHSGLLLEGDNASLLVDVGANAPQHLLGHGHPPDFPSAIYVSHMHSDHTTHLASTIQTLWLRGRKAPLGILAPAGVVASLRPWLEQSLLFPGLIGFEIQWQELRAAAAIASPVGTLTPFATTHLDGLRRRFAEAHPATCFDCFGFRLQAGRQRLVVSTDLGAATDLAPALHDPVHTLVVELAHFSGEALLEAIRACTIERVWLTHYPDSLPNHLSKIQALARQVNFGGEIRLATDGWVTEV